MRRQANSDQALLQDAEGMRAFLQGQLRSAEGTVFDIRSCEIDYIRQSATRNVVQYTLGLGWNDAAETSSQIVTVVSYGGDRTQKQWLRLMQGDPKARKPVGPLALLPVAYVPEFDLLLQVFPYDSRLPGLVDLINGSSDIFASLLVDADTGYWEAESWDAEVLRYRPDMRAMVRLDIEARQRKTGNLARRRGYAKVYREGQDGSQAFRLQRALWERTQDGEGGFAVAQPVIYIESMRTLLVKEASGERLLQVVRRRGPAEAEDAIRSAARAVAGMHQVALPEGLLPVGQMEKQAQLADVAAGLAKKAPVQAAAIEELVAAIGQAMEDAPVAPTHFDLKQGHILLNGGLATILDFDKMALGNPLVDVANLAATLSAEREGSQVRTERRADLLEAFVDEYFAYAPEGWRAQFPANFALAALLEAGTTGRGQRGRAELDDRAGRVVSALMQAQRALGGELW